MKRNNANGNKSWHKAFDFNYNDGYDNDKLFHDVRMIMKKDIYVYDREEKSVHYEENGS